MLGTAGGSLGKWAGKVDSGDTDAALIINQRSTGLILDVQDDGTTRFSIADGGAISGSSFLDDDTLGGGSSSASGIASQQSIKAYVDAQIATEDTIAELNDTNIGSLAAGHILVYDDTASVWDNVAITADDGLTATLGDGTLELDLDLKANGGLSIDTNELTVTSGIGQYAVPQYAASVADDDFLRIDGTAVEGRSASEVASDIGAITSVVAGDGLSGGATSGAATVTLDLNELTAAVVADGDFIPIIDTNDSNGSRKEAVHDLATLFSGTGLTATSSVINVGGLTVTEFAGAALQTSGESFVDNDTSLMTSASIQDKILAYSYSTTTGTVTSVGTTGTVNGLTLSGTVTSSGNLTLGGTLAINNGDWSGTDLAVGNGGTGASTLTDNAVLTGTGASAITAESNLTFTGSLLTVTGAVTVGVDDAGHDVKFFGDTAGSYMLWDTSANDLIVAGTNPRILVSGNATGDTPIVRFESNSTARGYVGTEDATGGSVVTGAGAYDMFLRTEASHIYFATDANNARMSLSSGGIDLLDNDLLNVGASGSDWDATSLRNAGDYFGIAGKGMVIGHSAFVQTNKTMEFQIIGDDDQESGMSIQRYSNDDSPPRIWFAKSNGALGTPGTAVTDDAVLGEIRFMGDDGGDLATNGALIQVLVDDSGSGSIAANQIPAAMTFYTAAGASANDVGERMRIDPAGNVGIGATAPSGRLHVVVDDTYGEAYFENADSVASNDFGLKMQRAKGTIASKAIVADGDRTGFIGWQGYDGSSYKYTSAINSYVDGTPGTNDMPGRLTFSTTPDDSITLAERIRIHSTGEIDLKSNALGLTNVGASGNDWTATAFTHDGGAIFNDSGGNYDFRVEGDTDAALFVLDAGADAIGLGIAGSLGNMFMGILPGNKSRDYYTSFGTGIHLYTDTLDDNNSTETKAIVPYVHFGIPTYTADNANTYTDAATLYVAGAPVASTNITITNTPLALWVDSGASRFDGAVEFGQDGTDFDVTFYGDTSGRNMVWDAGASVMLFRDSTVVKWGTGGDAYIYYDGTNLLINPKNVGSGRLKFVSGSIDLNDQGSILNVGASGNDWTSGTLTHTGDKIVLGTGNTETDMRVKNVQGVANTATNISEGYTDQSGLFLVQGVNPSNGARFVDLVLAGRQVTPTKITSLDTNGSPTVRTYSSPAEVLKLAMADTDAYDITVFGIYTANPG